MAYSYTWPATLPQAPLRDGFGETGGVLAARSPMDKGPAKLRRLGAKPSRLAVAYWMTSAQVETLRTFIESTIKGTARFGWPHPRTQATVEARLIPGGEGDYYTLIYISPGTWQVGIEVEVLP
ncbi:MAG: hypothetical protein A3J29_16110 [Acidobacteria bacterium RIFCSPLOWO2_12_FULL_67_14b]|nr:MAG: hypothetical protein A3J29_16110 [Acidobacteria bacterium RIFCSPLOWO2_12_FULL_67_14b]